MSTLGFDNYVEPLKLYLQKYREATKGDKQAADGFDDLGDDMLSKLERKNSDFFVEEELLH